jgi:hypothetical protein
MERITKKHLESKLAIINKKLNPSGELIGSFELSYQYSGAELVQITSVRHCCSSVLGSYHRPKRELYKQMKAFIAGINAQPNQKVYDW